MTSEDRIAHRVQAPRGSFKKLFGLGHDKDYQSWIVASTPKATEPAGKDNSGSVKR
jgi:hypothetical protein